MNAVTEDIDKCARRIPACEEYISDCKKDFSQKFIQFVAYVKKRPLKDIKTKLMWLLFSTTQYCKL